MPLVKKVTDVDYSIVLENARNYETLLSPPEIEYPIREVVSRSESSGLPDGSHLIDGDDAPMGEPLDKAIARLSRLANLAWHEWIKSVNEADINQPINPTFTETLTSCLTTSIEDAMLSEQEKIDLLRIKRLIKVEEITYQNKEKESISRLLEESSGFSEEERYTVECFNRFYEHTEVTRDTFGATVKKILKIDRCKGQPEIKVIPGVHSSDIAQARFNPSQKERTENIIMSVFQTEKWRTPAREEKDKYLPNKGIQDDPDFIPPSDLNSRNFVIYPPASRPYNIVFKVKLQNQKVYRLYPKVKKGKDYTCLSSLKYILDQKKVNYASIEMDEFKVGHKKDKVLDPFTEEETSGRPNCKFEIDLRVTYGEELTPDPNNYKKVDPDTKLGKKLLQLLNEQPNLFNEYVWQYESIDSKGNNIVEKKVAVGYTIGTVKDPIGPRIYWVYLDEKTNSTFSVSDKKQIELTSLPSFIRPKKVPPQFHYQPMSYYKKSDPNYQKKDHPFLASVRVSKNYSYYDRHLKKLFEFKEIENNFISALNNKGYVLYSTVPESEYSTVMVYKFIHKDTSTQQQRKNLFLKLTNHHD
jgi:hypothetical protein